jgi:hypothetical protein
LGAIIIAAILIYAFNPYGINEIIVEYFLWAIEMLRENVFKPLVNVDEVAWEISPGEEISFRQVN